MRLKSWDQNDQHPVPDLTGKGTAVSDGVAAYLAPDASELALAPTGSHAFFADFVAHGGRQGLAAAAQDPDCVQEGKFLRDKGFFGRNQLQVTVHVVVG